MGPLIGGREDFWEELGAIKGFWEETWCVAGYFNVVQEWSEGYRLNAKMRRFFEVIDDLKLKDLPLQGGLYLEWRAQWEPQIQVRLFLGFGRLGGACH